MRRSPEGPGGTPQSRVPAAGVASRRSENRLDVVELADAISAVAATLDVVIGPGIGLDVRCDPDAGRVRVGRAEFEQLIESLAVNARHAMPDGGRLTIATRTVTVVAGHARRVSDLPPGLWSQVIVTGSGMEPEVAARLVAPCVAADVGAASWLATARTIVRRHGGSITVETGPGGGSSFCVSLPRVAEAPRTTTDPSARPLEGRETVLLVEDDREIRALIREILELHRYRVLAAGTADAAAALAGAHAEPIHLVIADVFTPGMGPRELVHALRRRHPDIRMLYISGHADHDIARRAGPLEGTLLRKPFAVVALARTVREVLDRASAVQRATREAQ